MSKILYLSYKNLNNSKCINRQHNFQNSQVNETELCDTYKITLTLVQFSKTRNKLINRNSLRHRTLFPDQFLTHNENLQFFS